MKNMKLQLRKLDQKLLDMAMDKALRERNSYVMLLLKGINLKNVTVADRDMLNDYLEIPAGTMITV